MEDVREHHRRAPTLQAFDLLKEENDKLVFKRNLRGFFIGSRM